MQIPALIFRSMVCMLPSVLMADRAASQTTLPQNSPFIASNAPAAAAAGETHELAAISTIGKATTVNVYDKQAKRGKWIRVGDTIDGIKVLSYDAAREQAVVQINGAEKILTLRKATGPAYSPVAATGRPLPTIPDSQPSNGIPVPATGSSAPVPPESARQATTPSSVPAATQVAEPQPSPAMGSVAFEEQEARMLVSDLLEIGVAQRKAYEEAQKKQQQDNQPAGSAEPPASPPPAAKPAGN